MTHSISPAARRAQDDIASDDYEVALLWIRHPDFLEDVFVSSDPTEVLSYEPYIMGTKSTWLGEEQSFAFVSMGVDLPDDATDAPMQGSLVLDILDSDIANILTSTIEPATVDIALVMRSSPDFIERQFLGLLMSGAEGDGGSISLSFSRRHVLEEPCPADRTTKERFPGLHP
ncbi:hypothetical protein OIU34_00575 [Pararhizobium sp. BT-229]|uniref:hypothetical protein n=1 Tax=Pararhizobium sp. BT-229 TaxID=2986923 RepID=UPI0021F78FCD|nr:hypothetical protein [Pararhizobium sp. BT-229]MCV9960380.1 hypothetical protein [Pararhizobium sp. BT-229]